MILFDNECVALNVKAENSKDVIFLLSSLLEKKGAVSANYGEAAFKREQSYPTGLPTKPYNSAFPHAGSEQVHQSALAVAILSDPVIFKSMEDPHIELPASIVVLMAIRKPDEQVKVLRQLVSIFSKPQKLIELKNQIAIGDLVVWVRKELKIKN
jgi:galactitol PTS system EIIA component